VSGVAFQLGKYGTEKAPEKLTEHAEHVSKHALAKYEPKISPVWPRSFRSIL
jgi:hypothetical protein